MNKCQITELTARHMHLQSVFCTLPGNFGKLARSTLTIVGVTHHLDCHLIFQVHLLDDGAHLILGGHHLIHAPQRIHSYTQLGARVLRS